MSNKDAFHIYDTTLRDGAQQEGLNLSVHDKLTIARHLDDLGVGFIEGGWPGANPKDTEFFKLAQTELKLKNATFVAFGATRRPGVKAADDQLLRALQDSKAPAVTLVAKSHDRHVDLALKTHLDENLAMIKDSIESLIIAKFSSRCVLRAKSTCLSWLFATKVTAGAFESCSARSN